MISFIRFFLLFLFVSIIDIAEISAIFVYITSRSKARNEEYTQFYGMAGFAVLLHINLC